MTLDLANGQIAGPMTSGAATIQTPIPANPALAGLMTWWQVLTVRGNATLGVSNPLGISLGT